MSGTERRYFRPSSRVSLSYPFYFAESTRTIASIYHFAEQIFLTLFVARRLRNYL